jgi:hypothetical protein
MARPRVKIRVICGHENLKKGPHHFRRTFWNYSMNGGWWENDYVNIVRSGGTGDKASIYQDSLDAVFLCPLNEFGQFDDFDFPFGRSGPEPGDEFIKRTLVNSGREIAMFVEIREHEKELFSEMIGM